MSDTSNPIAVALGLAPSPAAAPGPTPPDAETVARLTETHRRSLAGYNPDDPSSPVYRRPDLAAQYRERAQTAFDAILANAGIRAPTPPSPAQVADERFEAQWPMTLPESLEKTIDEQLEAEGALDASARAGHVMALVKEFGREAYDRMVAEAKASLNPGEKLPDAAVSNRFVLQNLAAMGRYLAARDRAAAARRRV
jgi:hypothetical protein